MLDSDGLDIVYQIRYLFFSCSAWVDSFEIQDDEILI